MATDMALVKSYLEEFNELSSSFEADTVVGRVSLLQRLEDCVKQSDLLSRTNRNEPELVATVEGMKSRLALMKMASLTGGVMGAQQQQQQKVASTMEDKMASQNKRIQQAQQTVSETEETGKDILGELARNREKIASVQERTRDFTGEVNTAEGVLKSMSSREKCVVS